MIDYFSFFSFSVLILARAKNGQGRRNSSELLVDCSFHFATLDNFFYTRFLALRKRKKREKYLILPFYLYQHTTPNTFGVGKGVLGG
ncbi:MAG: hypothetical protein IKB83_01555 [Mycoplasmataceae bacterium]|nr:hypothetical protein [Mycoplasmataceae bacterium]